MEPPRGRRHLYTLAAVGAASAFAYVYALQLGQLRLNTVEFEFAFFAVFGLYLLAVSYCLGVRRTTSPGLLALILGFGILFRSVLVFSMPALSDDMYRYVWDGRVQANQINPYVHPPNAPELTDLRDDSVWPNVNRKHVVTVYPAGAELAFAAIWRISPDNVRWFQIVMASGDVLAGVLLIFLLRALGRPGHLALIYLWNPLTVFETAHSAHVDGLVLPLLVGAFLAQAKGRSGLVGLLLGAATSLKLYPVLLFPALWNPPFAKGRMRAASITPLAFVAVFASTYLPYYSQGSKVIGFLPDYFDERFNQGLSGVIGQVVQWAGGEPGDETVVLMFAALVATSVIFVLRPAASPEQAIRRCVWPIGVFTLVTPNLMPWYLLWLIPLLALFLEPGRLGFRLNSWTAWLLFTGLVALSYVSFASPELFDWMVYVEFLPLYALLVFSILRGRWRRVRLREDRGLA